MRRELVSLESWILATDSTQVLKEMFYQEKEAHTAVAGCKVIALDNLADRELNLASKSVGL